MQPLSYAEAVHLLTTVGGWSRSDVEKKPDDALWAASGRLVEARDVIRAANAGMR